MILMMLLLVYIHTGQARKISLSTVGIKPTTFGILAQRSANYHILIRNITYSNQPDRVAQLTERCWASIPKIMGSIPTVAGHIFYLL